MHDAPPEPSLASPPTPLEVIKNLVILALVIGLAYLVTAVIGVERLEDLANRLGLYGLALIVLLKATTIIVVPLGGGIIYPVAGAVYGFWPGWALTLLGDFLGFSVAFFLARAYGRPLLRYLVPKTQWHTFEKIIRKSSSWKTLAKARIALSPVPELFAYAAGLTTARYAVVITVMMALQIPGTAALTLFGDLLLSGNPTALLVAGLIGGAAVFGGGWLLHRDLSED